MNKFAEKITSEELLGLPQVKFPGHVVIIDSPDKLKAACDELLAQQAVGFDTETRPTFTAGPLNKVALLQLSTADKCFLFRLCKMRLDKSVIKILESKKIIKIGADVKGDLRALSALRKFTPAGFVDLQEIVCQWGIQDKSVRSMAGIILGHRISKAQRLSNWEASALTPAQQSYAATDAWICLQMYNKLQNTPSQ